MRRTGSRAIREQRDEKCDKGDDNAIALTLYVLRTRCPLKDGAEARQRTQNGERGTDRTITAAGGRIPMGGFAV